MWEAFRTALRALRSNWIRSALTMIGIIIGVAAVILSAAMGKGLEDYYYKLVGPLARQITITKSTGHLTGMARAQDLTTSDVKALRDRSQAPHIASVMALVTGVAPIRAGTAERKVNIIGAPGDYLTASNRRLAAGRFLTPGPAGALAREAVLGPAPLAALFGGDPYAALGKSIRISRTPFTVVGTLTTNGIQDDVAVIPQRAATNYLFGSDEVVGEVIVEAASPSEVELATDEVLAVLDRQHHIPDLDHRDYETLSWKKHIEQDIEFMAALRAFIASVGAISLLVGGVGIANIMLVSVTERTHEIGLRKAVGASRGAIVRQFLIEAGMLSSVGGVAGALFGLVATRLLAVIAVRALPDLPAITVPMPWLVLALGVSALIGVVAGTYPAVRAARMTPLEALRQD